MITNKNIHKLDSQSLREIYYADLITNMLVFNVEAQIAEMKQ